MPEPTRPPWAGHGSQTFLQHADRCLQSAWLYKKHAGGPSSVPKQRGTLLHLVWERMLQTLQEAGEPTLYARQKGESIEQARRGVSSMVEELVEQIRDERPDLHVPHTEADQVRLMAYHLAVAMPVDPQKLIAVEGSYVLDVLGWEIRCRVDTAEIDGDTVWIKDVKTSFAIPSDRDYVDSFQRKCYSLALVDGYPVDRSRCRTCEGAETGLICPDCAGRGYVEERQERDPRIAQARWVVGSELYPRYLRDDFTIPGPTPVGMSHTDLHDFRVDLERLVSTIDQLLETGEEWPAVPGHHCFGAETRFLTDRGVRTLGDAAGEKVRVLDRRGHWRDAEIRSFGRQPLVRVSLDDGTSVRATPDHRWWRLKKDRVNGGWIQTDERVTTMEVDRVPLTRMSALPDLDVEGVRHGVVYGDGTRRRDRGWSQVLLQSKKAELERFFDPLPVRREHLPGQWKWHRPVKPQDDGTVLVTMQPLEYKELPGACTPEYARGFVAGLIATDGHVGRGGGVSLHCEGLERARRIAELAWLGGCAVTSVAVVSRKTPAVICGVEREVRDRELTQIRLRPATAPVVRTDQAARLNERTQMRRMYLNVVGVEADGVEEVFCAVVPGAESFTLANGVATSNCFQCPASHECPLPAGFRGPRGTEEGLVIEPVEIRDLSHAQELAMTWHWHREHGTAIRKALRGFAERNEVSIRFGRDLELLFQRVNKSDGKVETKFDRRRLTAAELEAEGREAA